MKRKKFIVFFSPMLDNQRRKDGMGKRIIAIDTLVEDANKIYIENTTAAELPIKHSIFNKRYRQLLKWRLKCLMRKYSNLKFKTIEIETIGYHTLEEIFKHADKIYAHSLYEARYIPNYLLEKHAHKIIIDVHGCVCEEAEFQSMDPEILEILKNYEELAFNKVHTLITVSKNMEKFYRKKYPETRSNFLNLPIFALNPQATIEKSNKDTLNVIYSGGTQKWQNADLMIEAVSKTIDKGLNFTILTPDQTIFNEKLKKYSLEKKVCVKYADTKEIIQEYKQADLGFILRDDIIVNNLACPTKLIEYLENGIIPIVLSPNIGDFNDLGYKYISYGDFIEGKIPNAYELGQMRIINEKVITKLKNDKNETVKKLKTLLES